MRILILFAVIGYSYALEKEVLTSNSGAPIGDVTNTMTVGPRGPLLVQDTVFLETLASFNRERIPERVVHPKGVGAFGTFEVTDDIRQYCKANIFSEIGKKTPLFVRFSLAAAEGGSPDTIRDLRGFAIKFYTDEGNWDLVGMNSPIFFLRDALLVPMLTHCSRRDPVTNLMDSNRLWDFLTLRPESTHQITRLYSDIGIPDGYRYMNGYGSNTFKLVNSRGQAFYCKFHHKSNQGIRNLSVEQAEKLKSSDPDYATRDLYNAIENGDYPSWTTYIQIMTFQQAENWYFNPFDVTKVWPEEEFPLIRVGKFVLNKNPRDYFAEVEQSAFCPANLVPGIEPSPDKFLQGRLFAYSDTQRHRLGANFKQLPINCPFSPPRNYERDGPQTINQEGGINYYPNSFGGPVENPIYRESCFRASGDVCRYNSTDEDNYTQARIYYRQVLKNDERARLVQNLVKDLAQVHKFIQERAVRNFFLADPEFGMSVQEGLE